MDSALRSKIMDEPSIQKRITRLFKELPYVPIPRGAVETVARTTGDPMRRVRADAGRSDVLDGMTILSASYANQAVEALGQPRLERGHFMSVPQEAVASLSIEARSKLSPTLRSRLLLD